VHDMIKLEEDNVRSGGYPNPHLDRCHFKSPNVHNIVKVGGG
jgi:hypothetical protein